MLRRSFARSRQLQQPRALLRLAVGQRDRLCWLGGLGRPESRQHQTSEDRFVFPLVTVHKTTSTSCRRSSMRKWWHCTLLHSVRSSQSGDFLKNIPLASSWSPGRLRQSHLMSAHPQHSGKSAKSASRVLAGITGNMAHCPQGWVHGMGPVLVSRKRTT